MPVCHACGTAIADPRAVTRYSTCSSCGKDLRVCLNCRFYDPSAHWQCREDIPEEVREKDRANFCEYFMLRRKDAAASGDAKKPSGDDKAREDFFKLFGDG